MRVGLYRQGALCRQGAACVLLVVLLCANVEAQLAPPASSPGIGARYETVTFPSADDLVITADLYLPHQDLSKPLIVLCHQAGWSRGEYREIAPKLGELGFNSLAIDQRSGNAVNGVGNETAKRAASSGKRTGFVDAEQDIVAAVQFAREKYARGKLVLWGSSYSSALALRIAGEQPKLVDGVLAFAPGEYFGRFGKSDDWIAQSAKKIVVPAFITSAKNEGPRWKSIYDAIPGQRKVRFLPETAGNHGSRALWEKFSDSEDYWKAVRGFLQNFD